MSALAALNLELHPKQAAAFQTEAIEVLYGGAAGGGKSYLIRVAALLWCSAIPGLQVYLFRRIRDDLIKNHMEGPKGFRALLAGWAICGFELAFLGRMLFSCLVDADFLETERFYVDAGDSTVERPVFPELTALKLALDGYSDCGRS